jgi:hypothetical protein
MNTALAKVSIGLPVYNGQNYLGEAIESLLAQSFGDFEILISDNASTDGTESICRAYAARDRRIRYYRQEVNQGAAWNHNYTFALAQGEYFKWNAHDDLYAASFIASCFDVLQRDPEVLWCFSRFSHIDSKGRTLADPRTCNLSYLEPAQNGATPRLAWTRASELPWQRFAGVLLGGTSCLDCYGLMRTAAMRKTGLLRPYYGSEKVFVSELCLLGRYAEVPEPLAFVRVHPEGSGALPSAAEQAEFVNPLSVRRCRWTRFKLLQAYYKVIQQSDLSWHQRARCQYALLCYLFQLRKWNRVLWSILRGTGVGGGNIDLLNRLNQQPPDPKDSGPRTPCRPNCD